MPIFVLFLSAGVLFDGAFSLRVSLTEKKYIYNNMWACRKHVQHKNESYFKIKFPEFTLMPLIFRQSSLSFPGFPWFFEFFYIFPDFPGFAPVLWTLRYSFLRQSWSRNIFQKVIWCTTLWIIKILSDRHMSHFISFRFK